MRRLLVGAVGALLLLQPLAAWAQATPEFNGFNLAADASGVAVTFGDPSGAPYPVAAGVVPQAQSSLSTGPSGYALASVLWPGPLAGNLGSLAGLLLPACFPDGSGVCSPPAPPEVAAANYPIRAEARSPNGPAEVALPGMTARASATEASAAAQATDAVTPDVFSVVSASASTRNALEQGKAVSTAKAVVSGFSVGGVINIDSVITEARASTDGKNPVTSGRTVVNGLMINGEGATVDEAGVHFGDQTNPSPAEEAAAQLNEQLFKEMGAEMFLVRPAQSRDGETVRYRSGSLVIVWAPDGRNTFIVTLGGASVTAQASPGSLFEEVDSGLADVPLPDSSGSGDLLAAPPLEVGGASLAPSPSLPALRADASADGVTTPVAANAVYFRGVSLGNVLLALLGALLVAVALRRVAAAALAGTANACPLEGSPE